MIVALNLLRLAALFLLFLPIGIFNKNAAVFYFLKLAGPSFIKLGQILSVRPDLVGVKLSKTLATFQDHLKPCSPKKLQKILDQEFGKNFSEIFAEFNFDAVASASIAQVHKAQLKSSKEFVAVKIMRPRISQIMARDISTLKILIKFLAPFSSFLAKSFLDVADLLEQVSRSELDLLQEAANASKLKEDLKNVKGFYVPEIFWKFSTTKILVLEWLDGIPFSDIEKILASPFDKKQIAQNLVISYFNQVYVHGFFHADMHPGNLFLLKNGNIAVVDFGIMGKIDKKTRLTVAEILIGFLNKDYHKVAELHINAGLVPRETKVEELALSCRKIGEMIVGSDVKDISVAKLLSSLITMMRDYKMETRPELLLLQKTLLLVEGVGVSLDPNLNIWDLARPWVKEWAMKNIGFDAKIRDTVIDLLELARRFLRNI
ncbi:MAG: 2-polyprenylphenol 6-hydroxylase [Proteobacteria bacterium]|nr:2-polyprenylphenol 6-hydroxylase [Pseudomonadota bacterium]